MKRILVFILTALVSLQTFADEIELNIFGGYRIGGDMQDANTDEKSEFDETNSFGLLISQEYDSEYDMEFIYTSQNTDLINTSSPSSQRLNVDIEYFLIGGSQIWQEDKMDKFFGAAIGAIHLSPADTAFSSKSRFTLSIAGGAVYKLTKHIGLRLELRTYFSSLGDSSFFCSSDSSGGQCVFIGEGVLTQVEANMGLRFGF